MDYREKVMAYANVIQVFSDDRHEIVSALEAKVNSITMPPEQQEFWREVTGRVYRNSFYSEILEMIYLEKKYSTSIDSAPSVATIVNSPNLLKWIHLLPKFEEEVAFLLDYQKDNYVTEKANDTQAFNSCIGSLQFFNDGIVKGKSLEELFKYIPLMTWSIESLLITKQLNSQFQDFILNSFIPVLRAHRAAVLVFLDLVNKEDEYLQKEAETTKEGLTESTIFNRKYEPEKINLYVPADPTETDPNSEDPYLDGFAYTLRYMFNRRQLTGPRVDQIKKDWYFAPLSHLYRLRMHSDMLGCTDEYTPVMSPKLLNSAANKVYAHLKCYSERNLLESSILAIENVIMESQNTKYKDIYVGTFSELYVMLEENLAGLLRVGLVTSKGVADTLKRVRLRGEVYGLHKSFE